MNHQLIQKNLSESIHINKVVLNVKDLEKETRFYQEIIGLTLFHQEAEFSELGAGKSVLLRLEKSDQERTNVKKTGLYHLAFLLPSRQALGDALYHYLNVKAPLQGASNHGYSEALYLVDPEGNGIEVYWDKPKKFWDIRESGEIVGITEEMDVEGVLNEATGIWSGFPEETMVGHVHLKVSDIEKTDRFYQEVLGLNLKYNFGSQAKFFAYGSYHHHIGSNIWMGRNVELIKEDDLGLAYFTIVMPKKDFEFLVKNWRDKAISFELKNEYQVMVTDPNGIRIVIEVE